MLKWTASAFAMAAAMQLGLASAQETEAEATIVPPGPSETEAGADDLSDDVTDDVQDARDDAAEQSRDALRDARENLQDARDDEQRDAEADEIEREARFGPNADGSQVDERVRSATANLDIDDATRSRYRFHNGEWWFKTKSGIWKYHREGRWQDFDPTSYRAINSGSAYGPGSANWVPQGNTTYVQPQQFQSSSGYIQSQPYSSSGGYIQSQPYTTQRYGVYRPNYDRYDGRYGNTWNDSRGWNSGDYGDPRFNSGWGQGYNPGNDRYYGRGAFGQPQSISGDRYRGGVIGSQIGGQIGGRTGSIIGGAIGADAAD